MGQVGQTRRAAVRSKASSRYGSAWLAAAALSVACSGQQAIGDYPVYSCDLAEPPTVPQQSSVVSVATFWTADPNENTALQTLLDSVDRDRYVVETQQMRTRGDAQRHINAAFENEQLPDVFQVNGGSDVLRWVENRTPDSTDVCPLEQLRKTYEWDGKYFAAALEPLVCHGQLYGLPVGIHNLNVLFYNQELFASIKASAAKLDIVLRDPGELSTPYEFLDELEQVQKLGLIGSKGAPLVPLALGAENQWPLTIVAFENVLLSLGRDVYETLWLGGISDPQSSRARDLQASIREMLKIVQRLTQLSNAKERVSWQDAVRQVGNGEALFTITGDWGWAQLTEAAATKVQTVTFPGTAGSFVYTPDSFAVPREFGKSGFAARAFLHDAVENQETLLSFSRFKHSIPPLKDLSDRELEALASDGQRATYKRFSDCANDGVRCKLLLAVSGLGPPPGTDPCFDEIDALLTLAATGVTSPVTEPRLCPLPFPIDPDEATWRLVELLSSIGNRRFAADCR